MVIGVEMEIKHSMMRRRMETVEMGVKHSTMRRIETIVVAVVVMTAAAAEWQKVVED